MKFYIKKIIGWIDYLRCLFSSIDANDIKNLSPLFIIGANRSGTSAVSFILSSHPELEGLFSESLEPTYSESGHSFGFCESMHIWANLLPNPQNRRGNGHLPYWGIPNYLNEIYRFGANGWLERKRLIWDIYKNRKTDKSPLIKNQLNALRIGLIVDLFPNARFILVTRPWKDFTERSIHKWKRDELDVSFRNPLTGYQWALVNTVALFDLEIYAKNHYSHLWLDKLHASPESAKAEFSRVMKELNLGDYECDVSVLNGSSRSDSVVDSQWKSVFENIKIIVEKERVITLKE
jgi:hypothetical protein